MPRARDYGYSARRFRITVRLNDIDIVKFSGGPGCICEAGFGEACYNARSVGGNCFARCWIIFYGVANGTYEVLLRIFYDLLYEIV